MALVGCFVTPHPPIVIPEIGGERIREAEPTLRAMQAVRQRTAVLEPDTIVLLSPHAALASYQMGVSPASSYHGSFAAFQAPKVRLDVEGDRETAHALLEAAAGHGMPATATSLDGDIVDLDHGAMVPLVFLLGSLEKRCKVVLLSFSGLSMDEHVRFGEIVGATLLEAAPRVVYVASGDMSHRLLAEGPYGFDPHGPQFDHAVEAAFAKGDWDALVSIPLSVARAAGECGYRSLAVLRGLMSAVHAAGIRTENHLLSYEGPFGVGYLVGEVEFLQQGAE